MKNHLRLSKSPLKAACSCLLTLTLASCATSKITPYDDPKSTNVLTKAEKRYWHDSKKAHEALENAGVLYRDKALKDYLNGIADRMYPEYADKIELYVVDNPSYNAFAMPNGNIYIHSAMLGTLENEAQIAIVIGHEVAHFVRKHGAIRADKLENGMAGGAVFNTIIPFIGLLGQAAVISSIYGLSRDNEREADRMGFVRFLKAGYPLEESVKAFAILQEESKIGREDEEESVMFASHPKLQERIDSFNELIEENQEHQPSLDYEKAKYSGLTAKIAKNLPSQFYEHGRYDQLLKHISNERRSVENKKFYEAMSMLKLEQKSFSEVEPLFEAQLTDNPDFAQVYREYGYLLAENDRHTEAKQHLKTYLELEPNSKDKWFVLDKITKIEKMEQQ